MKITAVETLALRLPSVEDIGDGTQDALVVKVHTDAGVVGLGEAAGPPSIIQAIIHAPLSHRHCWGLASLVLGEDPLEIRRLWERMYRGSQFYGRRGAAVIAMSAIDIALWDIMGKTVGRPVVELLGGAQHKTVPVYASTLMPHTPQAAAAEAGRWAQHGFRAIKFGWEGFATATDGGVELVRAIRKEIGGSLDIMLDVGFVWDRSSAVRWARDLQEFRPSWIEEPFWPDDLKSYAHLADCVDTPIAAGENCTGRHEFRDLIDRGHIDIVQPDVSRTGGLTEALRVVALAEDAGVLAVPHVWSTGILQAASLHLMAAVRTAQLVEFCVWDSPLNTDLVRPRSWIESDGTVQIPHRPGLGVELVEDVVEKFLSSRMVTSVEGATPR